MSEIHKTVTIDAPVERVFEFVDNPENIAKCASNVVRVVNMQRSERRVGDTFRVIYRARGMTFDEKFTVTGYEPPRKTTPHRRFQIWRSFDGGMKGAVTWTLEAHDNQTEASVDIEYVRMGGVLGKALDALLLKRTNEKNIEQILEKMKLFLAPQKA